MTTQATLTPSSPITGYVTLERMVSDLGVRVTTGASGRPQPLRRRDANRQPQPLPLNRSTTLSRRKQKQTPKMRQTNLTSTMRTHPRTAASTSASNSSNVDKGKKRILIIDISSSDEDDDLEEKKRLGRLSLRKKRSCPQDEPHAVIDASSSSSLAEDADAHAQNCEDNLCPSGPEKTRKRPTSKDAMEGCRKAPTETSMRAAFDILCRTETSELPRMGSLATSTSHRDKHAETTLNHLRQEVKLLTEDRDRIKQLLERERAISAESTVERRNLEERVKDLQTSVESVENERRNFLKAKDRMKELEERVRELEGKVKEDEARQVTESPDLTDLEEATNCDICTLKMWYPSTIPDCGHTFCETCLHDWFNRTYTQHVEDYPEFLERPPEYLALANQNPAYSIEVERLRREWIMRVPQPVYTCPACRKEVKQKPVEVFVVRDLVRKVAKASTGRGEESPELKRMSRALGNIWDGFFPECV